MNQDRFDFTDAQVSAFEQYHAENPHIYAKLREFALQAKAAGRTHIGIKMLYERVRWFTTIEAQGDSFKINNNFTAHYARKLMHENPALAGMFETRKSKADQAA